MLWNLLLNQAKIMELAPFEDVHLFLFIISYEFL